MTTSSGLPAYVVVTPVRDEAGFIAATIESVVCQTHLPSRWVIVDDGSTDQTLRIAREHAGAHPWISIVQTGSVERKLGSAEVRAFQKGMSKIGTEMPYEFIVKLDGDLQLPPHYFERLLMHMVANPRWGIVSGTYCERDHSTSGEEIWVPVRMPSYHAAGASKVVRRQCFEQIDGFVSRKGWDTVDEIRAQMRGWSTGHLSEVSFRHLKPEGMAMGPLQTHLFHGSIYYQTGGGPFFLAAKALYRMFAANPKILGGLAMLWGYLLPLVMRRPRLVSNEESRFYRSMLNGRLARRMTDLLRLVRS